MARDYWTCPICGANLDPGEHCDCDNDPTPEEMQDREQWDK